MQLNKTIEAKLREMEERQANEEEAFYIKAQGTKDSLEKQRSNELESFNKKSKIVMNDMENRQNAEKKQLEKNKSSTMAMSQALTSKHTLAGKSQQKP